MREEGEWLPGFIPAELVEELKVENPRQSKNKLIIFDDHDGKKKWFRGFIKTVDRNVLRAAVARGLRPDIAPAGVDAAKFANSKTVQHFEEGLRRFTNRVRHRDGMWGDYRDARLDLFNEMRYIFAVFRKKIVCAIPELEKISVFRVRDLNTAQFPS